MKFEIYQSKRNKKWYWHMKSNGKIIADGSQGYASYSNVRRALLNVRDKIRTLSVPIYKAGDPLWS